MSAYRQQTDISPNQIKRGLTLLYQFFISDLIGDNLKTPNNVIRAKMVAIEIGYHPGLDRLFVMYTNGINQFWQIVPEDSNNKLGKYKAIKKLHPTELDIRILKQCNLYFKRTRFNTVEHKFRSIWGLGHDFRLNVNLINLFSDLENRI